MTEEELKTLRDNTFGYFRNHDPHNLATPRNLITLFSGYTVTIEGLDAFALIEEMEQVMEAITLPRPYDDMLTMVYNNVKYQAYRCAKVTIEIL